MSSGDEKMNRREWLCRTGMASVAVIAASCSRPAPGPAAPVTGNDGLCRLPDIKPIGCRSAKRCDRCMPCGYGVDIPAIFLAVNKAFDDKILPVAADDPDFTVRASEFLARYDNAVGRKHRAIHCIGCYHCSGNCPAHIDIAGQLGAIADFTEGLRNLLCLTLNNDSAPWEKL